MIVLNALHQDGSGSARDEESRKRVAIVYQVLHHFREPVFRELVRRGIETPDYCFLAAATNSLDSNMTIDPSRAALPVSEGGLPWKFIRNIQLGGPFVYQTGVIRAAASRDTDVMIFLGNMYYVSTWLAALAARLRGKRVLFWGHGYRRREGSLKGWIRERFYRLGHGILLYGNRARSIMLERGFSEDGLYVIYNSLDYERQAEIRRSTTEREVATLRRRLFKHADLPTLVFIGRLEPRKRLEDLLDSVVTLKEEGLATNLLIIGGGTARSDLERRMHDRGIAEYVCFYGECYDESETGPLLMASDLCVCPGSVGLTAVHAMAYGVPVLSHDDLDQQGPEVETIIPGETGELYSLHDPADMTARIRRWIQDNTDRRTVSERCIAEVESRYNPKRQAILIDLAVNGVPAKETASVFA